MARVVTYKPGCYCQLKLNSGERIFISIAQSGIKIFKMGIFGMVPAGTIAEWGTSELQAAIEIFADPSLPHQHPLEAIKNKLITCESIKEVKTICEVE